MGEWDTCLSHDVPLLCTKWWAAMPGATDLKIALWVGFRPQSSVSVHMFYDASEKAVAVVYIMLCW